MKEDIIRMARKACDAGKVDAWHNGFWTLTQEELERFAALVAAAEREACAMEAEYEAARWPYAPECREPCEEIAKEIRLRGKK